MQFPPQIQEGIENDLGDKARIEHGRECNLAGLQNGEPTQEVS